MRFLVASLALLTLSGCAATVNLEPAEDSNNPGCAEVMVRLPSQLGGLQERYTNAQATAAWGDPAAVLLRCGLEPVEVSTLPCVSAAGIDWLVDDSLAPSYRFISYARFPAVEVIVDSDNASGITSLEGIAGAVAQLPVTKACLAP
ncbi:MAG: DUF3515 family protein [Aquiluna sp.]|jgi:hypothetical protein